MLGTFRRKITDCNLALCGMVAKRKWSNSILAVDRFLRVFSASQRSANKVFVMEAAPTRVGLMDAAISIELQGFPSGQPVTVAATQVYPTGSRWRASATFITDDTGSANLSNQPPVSGTYDGVSAMGLIWSAERVPAEAMTVPDGWITQPWYVHLEASAS